MRCRGLWGNGYGFRGIWSLRLAATLLAVLVCVLNFAGCAGVGGSGGNSANDGNTVIGGHSPTGNGNVQEDDDASDGDGSDDTKSDDDKSGIYIIEAMDTKHEMLTLLSEATGTLLRYSYSLTTRFLDAYGKSTSWSHFQCGQAVEIGEMLPSSALSFVQLSDAVWNYDDVKNYKVDTSLNMLTIGSAKYHLSDDTVVFSNDAVSAVEAIGENDVLRVVGIEKKVLSIAVTTGHGYIELINAGIFDGSLIEIGTESSTDIITTVFEGALIEVPEGKYEVTAANEGYGDTKTYRVKRNEITIVDLNELKGAGPKMCKLTFKVGVDGAKIYLDGTEVRANKTMNVTYGRHSLRVEAEGYDTWNKTLVVNSPSAEIELALTEEDSSSGSSGSNSSDNSKDDEDSEKDDDDKDDENKDDDKKSNKEVSDEAQAEVDYLTTLSSLLTNLFDTD